MFYQEMLLGGAIVLNPCTCKQGLEDGVGVKATH